LRPFFGHTDMQGSQGSRSSSSGNYKTRHPFSLGRRHRKQVTTFG